MANPLSTQSPSSPILQHEIRPDAQGQLHHWVIFPNGEAYLHNSIGMIQALQRSPLLPSLRERIDEQKDLCIENISLFTTIQYLWERTYGQRFDYQFYTNLINQARQIAKSVEQQAPLPPSNQKLHHKTEAALKKLFFAQVALLNEAQIRQAQASFHFVKKGYLRLSLWVKEQKSRKIYWLFNRILKSYVKRGVTVHLDYVHKIAEEGRTDDCAQLKNKLCLHIERFLNALKYGYNQAALWDQSPHPIGTRQEDICRALRTPKANAGVDVHTLYRKFGKAVTHDSLSGRWDRFVFDLAHRFFNMGRVVEILINTCSGSLRDNKGYTHNLNLLLLEQLKQIESAIDNNSQPGAPTAPISQKRKQQFASIIQQLLEIITLSEKGTLSQLSQAVQNTESALTALYTNTMQLGTQMILENIANLIATLTDQFVNEQQIEDLCYRMLKLTNDSFLPQLLPSEEVRKQTEVQVTKAIDSLLTKIIDQAVSTVTTELHRSLPLQTPSVLSSNPPIANPSRLSQLYQIGKTGLVWTSVCALPTTLYYGASALSSALPWGGAATAMLTTGATIWACKSGKHYLSAAAQKAIEQNVGATLSQSLAKGEDAITAAAKTMATKQIDALLRLSTDHNTIMAAIHHLLIIPHLQVKQPDLFPTEEHKSGFIGQVFSLLGLSRR